MGLRIGIVRTAAALRASLAVVAATAATLALLAAPAGAVIVQVKEGAETVSVGVQPRKLVVAPETPLQYHGGPVDPQSFTYAIYWDPGQEYHSDWLRLIDGYLHDVGAASGELENVFALNGQYTEPSSTSRALYKSTFRGAYTDTFPYPSNGCSDVKGHAICLTDAQLRTELKRFIESEHLPTGQEILYFLLTPPAVTVCLESGAGENCSTSSKEIEEEAYTQGEPANHPGSVESATGFCSYHSAIEPSSATPIVYSVQPWIAGHAGHVNQEIPIANMHPTAAELACQNRARLIEPNQETTFIHFDSYETGLADLIINDLSIEQNNIVVDPVLDAWYQSGTLAEQGDMCQGVYSPLPEQASEEKLPGTEARQVSNEEINGDPYYLQYAYSSVGVTAHQDNICWSGVELRPHFTATNVVGKGDDVAFDGLESAMTLVADPSEIEFATEPYTVPLYKWEFGDGTMTAATPQASIIHSYSAPGQYTVTLTVTDSGGNVRTFSQTILVGGPASPGTSPTPAGAGGAPTVSPAPAPSPAVTVTPAVGSTAGPTLTQSVLSHSLSKAARRGLAIKYDVDEQVAGRAEALLEKTTASRLGVKGALAVGLPRGYPREVVVGDAVVVTTRAGQGTVRIRFAKAIAKKLAKAHQLKLTLRFVLRNVSSGSVHTTTALSTVLLSH